jgi:hypothetical protein
VEIDPKNLQTLQTLTIDPNEIGAEAALAWVDDLWPDGLSPWNLEY